MCIASWLALTRFCSRACFALGLSLPTTYVALEQRIGHTFKQDLRLSAVVAVARMLDALDGQLQWARGDAIHHQLGEAAAADYLNRLALAA
ncbi:hypothetical protein [Streptomyces sp. SYSU K217416]